MRNLVDEAPMRDLRGRLAWSRTFVEPSDLSGKDVLDVGCGYGWFELVALDAGARSVVGVEPTESDLRTVRTHLDDPALSFRVAGALDLPFDDASFDTIVCWEVLEHLPRGTERRAFSEFGRVLRPGGALYLSTPHDALLPKLLDPAWWLIGHRHYSRDRVRELAHVGGLTPEVLTVRGRGWEIAMLLNMYVAKWVFRRRPFAEETLQRRVDREWECPGFANVFIRCRKERAPSP